MVLPAVARPKYWTWCHYSHRIDWDEYFQQMNRVGVRGLILQSSSQDMEKVVPIAKKYGIEVHAWMWVLNNGGLARENPEWLDYNRDGFSLREKEAYVGYYKFLNPAIPEACDAIVEQMTQMAAIEGVSGISMDYCRYVDQILPTSLWPTYGIVQDREYAEWDYGYHPVMIEKFQRQYGYDPRTLEDPSVDSVWLQYRLDAVTDLTHRIGAGVRSLGKNISASPFPTPSMSRRMVRQDWGKWDLDVAFPMIYHGFYYEGADWIAQCVRECVAELPDTEIYCGLFVPDFRNASEGPTLTEAMQAALDAGASGIAVFEFVSMTDDQKEELARFIRSHP